MSKEPNGKDTLTLTFDDEQWGIIYREIPRSVPLRAELKDVADDAQTFGEAEYEFDADALATLKKHVALDWVDEAIALAENANQGSVNQENREV